MSARRRPARVLLVSPVASHPAEQGNAARIRALGEGLAARGVLCEFLYHTAEGLTEAEAAAMTAAWPAFHVSHAHPPREPRFAGAWGLDDWCPESLVARVAALHRDRRFDAVLVNYVWLSRVFEGLGGAPGPLRVLDAHDAFGGRREVAEAAGLDPSWFFTTEAEEGRGLARADLVLAIQSEEAALLAARGARAVLTVGHAAPPQFLLEGLPDAARAPFGVLASGNPWNLASVRALDAALAAAGGPDWLLAGSILRGAGAAGAAAPRSAPALLHPLPGVDAFYGAVGCVVTPTTGGTGLKIKTVEALMSGRPVLGTRHAFAGLPAEHRAHAAPDAAALAALMAEHGADPGFRAEAAHATRRLALRVSAEAEAQLDALAAAIEAAAPRG